MWVSPKIKILKIKLLQEYQDAGTCLHQQTSHLWLPWSVPLLRQVTNHHESKTISWNFLRGALQGPVSLFYPCVVSVASLFSFARRNTRKRMSRGLRPRGIAPHVLCQPRVLRRRRLHPLVLFHVHRVSPLPLGSQLPLLHLSSVLGPKC